MRKVLVAVALLAVLGGGIGFFASRGGGEGGGSGPEGGGPPAVVIEAAKVEQAPLKIEISAVGSLLAQEGVVVRPEIAGIISEILFTEGQVVQAGAPLLRLDDSITRAQLEQAKAEQALAERTLSRATALLGRGAGTEQARDEAAARQRTAAAAIQLAQASLDKTVITAPFTGTAGIRQVSLGDYVTPGQTLVSLQALDTLKVDFSVPESALGQLKPGLPVSFIVTAYPQETFTGTVSAIDPLINPNTRSVNVRAVVPNTQGKLRPGQFAALRLTLAEEANTLFVPAAALYPMGEQMFVFKITDGKAALAPVTVRHRAADRVAIATGLSVGDEVATAGHAKIMMFGGGQPVDVQIAGEPAATAPASAPPPAP